MLSNKIILRRQTRKMDRHRFYQNIRNGAKEAKRASTHRGKAPGGTIEDAAVTDRPTTLPNTGRKTTRFDMTNEDDADDLETQMNPRYDDSYETTKLSSGDIRTPHQPTLVQDQSFHRTIYSPRTDRRAVSRLPSPARSLAGLGDRLNDRDDSAPLKTARRDKSGDRSEVKKVETIPRVRDDSPSPAPPVVLKESTATNHLAAENKLLKMEMDDVSNQLETLKNEQEANIQRMNDARNDLERQHRNEIETLKKRMRDLEASKADLVQEVETQTKKRELIWEENERLNYELERAKGAVEHEQRTVREKLEKEKEKLEEDLEKKTELVDKLTADNALLKEQCLAAEKDRKFEEELNQAKAKLERKKKKLVAVRKDADELKKKKTISHEQEAELRIQIDKLASALKAKDLVLEETKKERRDALRERTDQEAKCKDLKEQLTGLHAQVKNAQKVNEQLQHEKNQKESDINRAKNESKNLKEQLKEEKENGLKLMRFAALEEKIGPLKENIREKDAKIATVEEKVVLLKDIIRERDVKLVDLQTEIDTLRHAVEGYQKQMDAIRHDPKIKSRPQPHEVSPDLVTPDHAIAHRRLLDENGRLLTLLDHYRHVASQPPLVADEGLHYPIMPARVPAQRSSGELVEAKRQLRSSEDRVAQLEKWLDEIYNDKNFQVVAKSQGRTSLPDLPRRLVMVKGSSSDPDKKFRTGHLTDRAQ